MIDLQSFSWMQGSDEYADQRVPFAQRLDPTRVLHFGANKEAEDDARRRLTQFFRTAKSFGKFLKNY